MANKPNMTSTTFSLTLGGRESSLSRSLPFMPSIFPWIVLIGFSMLTCLSFDGTDVHVFHNGEPLDGKTVRVVVRASGIHKPAHGDEASFRHVAFPEYHLPCVGLCLVGIIVEVADHAVNLQRLVDVSGDEPVIKTFLRKVLIIVVCALVRQQQGSFHIVLDGTLFGRERKEQLMKSSHMLPCLGRSVL